MGPGQLEGALPTSGDDEVWSVTEKLFQRNHKGALQETDEHLGLAACRAPRDSNATRQTRPRGPFTHRSLDHPPRRPAPTLEEAVVELKGGRWNNAEEGAEQTFFLTARFQEGVKPMHWGREKI